MRRNTPDIDELKAIVRNMWVEMRLRNVVTA